MTMFEPRYMQTFIKTYGLCLEEVSAECLLLLMPMVRLTTPGLLQVRMSPDMLVAYVLWSAHPQYEQKTQQELKRQ